MTARGFLSMRIGYSMAGLWPNTPGDPATRFRFRGLAEITLPILAWSFGRWLRCPLLTAHWAGYARASRVGFPSPPRVSFPTGDERFAIRGASGQNPCAIIGNSILARPLRTGQG